MAIKKIGKMIETLNAGAAKRDEVSKKRGEGWQKKNGEKWDADTDAIQQAAAALSEAVTKLSA